MKDNKTEAEYFYKEVQECKGNYDELLERIAHALEINVRKVRVMLCMAAEDKDEFMKVRQRIIPIFAELALYLNARRDEYGISWEDSNDD